MPEHFPQQSAPQLDTVASENKYNLITDPWEVTDSGDPERDESWLLSYVDILTLFLVLLVVILALEPKEQYQVEVLQLENEQQIAHGLESDLAIDQSPVQKAELLEINGIDSTVKSLVEAKIISEEPAQPPQEIKIANHQNDVTQESDYTTTAPTENGKALNTVTLAGQHSDRLHALVTDMDLNQSITISSSSNNIQLEMNNNILFTAGSATLKDEGNRFLDELATIFLTQQGLISVEGHTDNQPIANERFPSNWELSAGRATMVTRYLISHGVIPERIQAVGYADTRPKSSNDTEQGRMQNRRVSLVIHLPDKKDNKGSE